MSTASTFSNHRRTVAVICAVSALVGVALADLPDAVFEITAQAGLISATTTIYASDGVYDPATETWTYSLPDTIDFYGGDNVFLGSLNSLDATVVEDPEVHLNFAVQAGPLATEFHIASQLLEFDEIADAEGRASAAYTLTDFDGGSATLTGIGDTGGAYLAQYNGWAGDPVNGPQGTTFAEGIPSMSAGFLETVNADFAEPATGFASIAVPVDSMSSLISFELSSQDLASGTSAFVVVPEPSVLTLLGLGGLALLRRRA